MLDEQKQAHPLPLFEKMININTIGTFNVVRLVAQRMALLPPGKDGERGLIITTSRWTFPLNNDVVVLLAMREMQSKWLTVHPKRL